MKDTPQVFFLAELQKSHPEYFFEVVKSPVPQSLNSDEPLYGYSHRESIKINGQGVGIEWLPHLNDMTEEQLEYILERCQRETDKFKGAAKKKSNKRKATESYKKSSTKIHTTASILV